MLTVHYSRTAQQRASFFLALVLVLALSSCASASGQAGKTNDKTSPQNALDGVVVYRERMALPPDAELLVRVFEQRADKERRLISELCLPTEGRNVPLPFHISLGEKGLPLAKGTARYEVEAQILGPEGVLFATATPLVFSLSEKKAEPLVIMTRRVLDEATPLPRAEGQEQSQAIEKAAPNAALLAGKRWRLLEIYGQPAQVYDNQPEPHLVFLPDQPNTGRLGGADGCNSMAGKYVQDGASLRFLDLASTLMLCPQGAEQSAAFARALAESDTGQVSGRLLKIFHNGTLVALFEAREL